MLEIAPLSAQAQSTDLFALDSDVGTKTTIPTPFKASGLFDEQLGIVHFEISAEPNAYIYKDSISISSDQGCKASLLSLPSGIMHKDQNATKEVYFGNVSAEVLVESSVAGSFVKISYQGCDENGICYPPQEYSLSLPAFNTQKTNAINQNTTQVSDQATKALLAQKANEEPIDEDFLQGGLIATLLLFVLLGASLDLTPCVLPLLGIFSAMILGSRSIGFKRAFSLNLSYLCGLVCVYTLLGWIFASLGMQAHAFLSSPLFTLATGAIFLILAGDCLGLINLKPPKLFNDKIQKRLASQSRGSLSSALIFGAFSGLLTTPCTSAPLAGALLYIAKEGNVLNGTLMFAAIGLGMGLPLCLIGLFGSNYLPKGGSFAVVIRRLIAVPLLFAAFVVMQSLWDYNRTVQIVFAGLLTMLTVFILSTASARISKKLALLSALMYGLSVSFCATQIIKDPSALPFVEISSTDELRQFSGKTVYLSLSASWCGNCHVMDEKVYSQKSFDELLQSQNITALRFDLSDPKSSEAQKIASQYSLSGVPAAFIIQDGRILKRLDGYHDLKEVLDFVGSFSNN